MLLCRLQQIVTTASLQATSGGGPVEKPEVSTALQDCYDLEKAADDLGVTTVVVQKRFTVSVSSQCGGSYFPGQMRYKCGPF